MKYSSKIALACIGILSVSVAWFFYARTVKATGANTPPTQSGVFTFRKKLSSTYDGTDLHKGKCMVMSLNEQLTARVNGKTGTGCDFTIDVHAGGEWVNTGKYFDTQPYSWGSDKFYSDGKDKTFSFTCTNPAYSFNSTSLPSYIHITREEIIPGTAMDPPGKRYHLAVDLDAQANASYNADLSFSTSCTMYMKEGSTTDELVAVENQTDYCGKIPTVNINPRMKTLKLPIKVGETCAQQLLPTLTPTPIRPACNQTCNPSNNQCVQECPLCQQNSNNTYTCQPPPPTPTLTPQPPACGDPCNLSNNRCPQLCPRCAPGTNGANVCQTVPTATVPPPTSSPTATSTPRATNTPAATSTPRATNTPVPTSTPKPPPTSTPIPTATPPPKCGDSCVASNNKCPLACPVCTTGPRSNGQTICRQPASCDCNGFEYSGQIRKGNVITFTAYVKVDDPDNNDGKGKDMVFHVEANGVEVAKSNPIPVTGPTRIAATSSANKPIDRYQASWSYTIPSNGVGAVEYRAYVKINCSYKSQGLASQAVAVLAASTKNEPGMFARIMQFFGSVFSLQPAASPTPTLFALPTGVDIRSGGSKTLKLGTLDVNEINPPRVQTSCKEMRFSVQY